MNGSARPSYKHYLLYAAMLGRLTWRLPECTCPLCVDNQAATGPCQFIWRCRASTTPLPRLPRRPQAGAQALRTARRSRACIVLPEHLLAEASKGTSLAVRCGTVCVCVTDDPRSGGAGAPVPAHSTLPQEWRGGKGRDVHTGTSHIIVARQECDPSVGHL